jgi:hypothetical protein
MRLSARTVEVHPARCQRCDRFSETGLYRVHYIYQNMTIFSDFQCRECAAEEEEKARKQRAG